MNHATHTRLGRILATAAVVAAAAAGLTGCSAEFGGATCDFNVQNAHNRHSNKEVMNAKATVNCSATVTDASMTIKMQRYSGGSWHDVAGTVNTTEYPTMAANVDHFFKTRDVKCVSGTYRAGARGSAELKGKPSGSSLWQYGNQSKITC